MTALPSCSCCGASVLPTANRPVQWCNACASACAAVRLSLRQRLLTALGQAHMEEARMLQDALLLLVRGTPTRVLR